MAEAAANPFDEMQPETKPGGNPFDAMMPSAAPTPAGESSMAGAFARGAERGALPALGGLAGAAAGASWGAGAGAAAGAAAGSVVPFLGTAAGAGAGATIGGLVGAVGGGFGASWAVGGAQEYALQAAPDSWKEAIGQDDRQRQLDEQMHPYASFIGGIAPFALTMRPGTVAPRALPENATTFQRLMADPNTARVFGGAAMGGMELGQEALAGEHPEWTKVAIATGFGLVFNKPTGFGETIERAGARVAEPTARTMYGVADRMVERAQPTLAAAADAKVVGPGVTESVFMGTEAQDPIAERAAQANVRIEQSLTAEPPAPDLHAAARRVDPETFTAYDDLARQREDIRAQTAEASYPTDARIDALTQQRAVLESRLADHLEERGGYKGGVEARQMRAQIRELQAQEQALIDRRKAFDAGEATDTAQLTALRKAFLDVDVQMRDLAPQVSAAYRRAAEGAGQETVAHPVEEAALIAAPEATVAGVTPSEIGAASIEQQRAAIAADVERQLIAAGRPADEAKTSGQLAAAYYARRAQRLGGAVGTAEELYRREGPAIRGDATPVPQTRTTAPKPVATPAAKPEPIFIGGQEVKGAAAEKLRAQIASHGEAAPVAHPEWVPGAEVSVGPINKLKVVGPLESEPGTFVVAGRNDTFYRVRPAEGLESLQRLEGADAAAAVADASARSLAQNARGSIRVAEGARSVITLMRDANASTFVHETGHQWLEDLVRDARHDAAPVDLKTDAATVRTWLKAEPDAPIKKAQHEKFARGFEQYMREGVAPSTELLGVFARFKNWLTSIYQTLKDLGAPINDDIRGVFDRLLADPVRNVVIASEREAAQPTGIVATHIAEARAIEPHEAEPAADRISAERARVVAELPEEIAREIATVEARIKAESGAPADAVGEVGAGAGGSAEVGTGRGGPEPVAGGGEGRDRSGPLGGGRGDAEAAGPSVSGRSEQRDDTKPPGGAPLAPAPRPILGAAESPFLDRAGNIRVENLTTREDVAQAIRDASDENGGFMAERRGQLSDGQILELADDLGMDAAKLNARKIGEAFNAEQVVAARKLLRQSATDVAAAMKKAALGTDEDVIAYAMAKDRHQMIQAQIAGITAEAGRALRAFRSIAGDEAAAGVDQFIRTATGKTLYQLRMEAKLGATLETPQQVSKFMVDAQKRTFGRMTLEYWINGLLSGVPTHATNMISNTILAVMKIGPETAAAALSGRVATALGREGTRVRIGEVGAQFGAIPGALAPAAKASLESFKTGVTTLLPAEAGAHVPYLPESEAAHHAPHSRMDETARWGDVAATAFGTVRGIRDGLLSGAALLARGGVEGSPLAGARYSPLGAIPDIEVRGVNVLPIGTVIRTPGRFLVAADSFFRAINYSLDKNAQAYRIASDAGLEGTAFAARVAEVRSNPSEAVMEAARANATELTLMSSGSKFVQLLTKITNTDILGFPFLKFIDPFVRTAANVLDQAIVKRTPVGLLAPEIYADIAGHNGNVAQDTAIGRMLVGTALSITAGGLAAQGLASGSGPTDRNQAAMWRLAGNQAHSVRIGDTWYAADRLGPLGILIGVAADLQEVAHAAQTEDMDVVASMLTHAFAQNILDASFMHGPAELLKALEDSDRYGAAYVRNFAASFLPFSVGMGQMARVADPYSRRARTVMDAVKTKIPGLSQDLFPRRDVWGEPMANPDALIARGVTGIYEKQVSTDPVNLAMLNLGIGPAAVGKSIRGVELTDQQYDDYARIAGRMAKMRLDAIVRSPDFQRWPVHVRHDVIVESVKQARESARGMVMMKYPDIIRTAYQDKIAHLRDED